MENRKLLTRAESAEYLTEEGFPTSKGFLQKIASVGNGPLYRIYGNRALYNPTDLIKWAESRLSQPRYSTSEIGAEEASKLGGEK